MKITLKWLKEHLETEATLDEVTDRLTMLGLEVESVEDRAKGLESFVVGKVTDAKQHPNADKLRICTVDNGTDVQEVVCGAPNARTGLTGVFAASGAYIPGTGITLKKAEIRGVESNGMLLSEREMGISDEHDGIIELADGTPIGSSAIEALGLDDPIIDIAITPNRGDCLGVRGIARDMAASGIGVLKPLPVEPVLGTFESPIRVHMDLDAEKADACTKFVGRYVRGVKNAESPKWLKDKLLAVGLRPISALVDITNLMTIEHCRPLHVFDADKVKGDIHVRMARPGETLEALNDKAYEMDAEMTVIADDKDAEALGGVMGGLATGCTEDTVNVFVESALFDPVRTATTGRKLNLQSDARFRFERGIDSGFLETGMEIATRLILDICGGEASELVVAGSGPAEQQKVSFRPARVKELAGVDVEPEEMMRILDVLGFAVEDKGAELDVTVPTWRNDIVGEACLVEEVVRVYGYDKVPMVSMERDGVLPHPALSPEKRKRSDVRRSLAARGLVEAVTLSFLSTENAALFGETPAELVLVNPISSDLGVMRPSILPNLIFAAGRNADRGIDSAALFEIGPQFSSDRAEGQDMVACGLRSGKTGERHWAEQPRPVDAFDAKADALAALSVAGAPVDKVQVTADAPAWYHPGRSGVIRLGPKTVLATFGEIHPGVLAKMDVKGPISGFEVFLGHIPQARSKKSAAKPHLTLSPLHPVSRDFAFVVEESVAADAMIRAVRKVEKDLIADVSIFDVFIGGNLGEGQKSVALTATLQPVEKTLTDAEIEAISERIVKSVEDATGGKLRS